jgi:hypothetical protein
MPRWNSALDLVFFLDIFFIHMIFDTVFLDLKIYGRKQGSYTVGSRNLSLNNIVTKPLDILQYKRDCVPRQTLMDENKVSRRVLSGFQRAF